MTFHHVHLDGSMTDGDTSVFEQLLDELEAADGEHTDVGLEHESGLAISVFASGRVVIEDLEDGTVGPMWSRIDDRAQQLALMTTVARGEVPDVSTPAWAPGYGPRLV